MAVPPPDDLPKSASGRIPKWVVDEAMGRPVEAPGFRSYGVPDPLKPSARGRPSKTRRWLSALLAVCIVSGLVYVAQHLGINPSTAPAVIAGVPALGGPGGTVAGEPHPINGPMPGLEEESSPIGVPATLSGRPSASYRFEATQPDGSTPVAWSPCRPIHYVVRAAHQPRGGAAGIRAALAAASAATGFRFIPDGMTSESPILDRDPYLPNRYGDRWAPVLIAWATKAEVPDFETDVAGLAGPAWVRTPSGDDAIVSGRVYLDPAKYTLIARTAGRAAANAVILHEVGHLLGLDHVNDRKQVMFPRSGPDSPTRFQRGDLTGLAALGSGACQPDA